MTDQERKKNARTSGEYDQIWQNTGKCVLCDLKDKYILHEENGVVLTVNIYPYIDGQMMVVPRRHVSSPKELSTQEWETMRKFSYLGKKLIKEVHHLKGMWTLIREGGVNAQMSITDHLHMQLIPFDNRDLCVWNFRELKYTPIENAELYREEGKEFVKDYLKFDEKYSNGNLVKVVLDIVIIDQGKVLLQKRKKNSTLYPNTLTLPGGHVDNFEGDLLDHLQREVFEEINYKVNKKDVKLLDSRLSQIQRVKDFDKLGIKTLIKDKHIWNTYLLTKFDKKQGLKAGDDCEEIIWLDLDKIETTKLVSAGVKKVIQLAIFQQ